MAQGDYDNRTYDDLSREFRALFSQAMRAFQLVPLMYNRLTLVDKLSHSQAVKKIRDDHLHLQGFSSRSIRRYLPADNPAVPHRIRPSWPKKSATQTDREEKLSPIEHYEESIENKEDQSLIKSRFLNKSKTSIMDSKDLRIIEIQRLEDQNQQLIEHVSYLQQLHDRDKATIKDLNNVISNSSFITAEQVCGTGANEENILFEFSLESEVIRLYIDSVDNDKELIEKIWFNGTLNKDTGKVIEINLGRMRAK